MTTTDDTSTEDTGRLPSRELLEVRDLKTHFRTPRGLVKAVDGVSLSLERGKTLGLVGESGSGKSVLSRSIMQLFPKRNVFTSGSVVFEGVTSAAWRKTSCEPFGVRRCRWSSRTR